MIPTNFGLNCFSGFRGEDFHKFTTDRRQTPSYSKSSFDPTTDRRQTPSYSKSSFDALVYVS